MGFLLGFFDKTQKPNPVPKKIGFFPSLAYISFEAMSPGKGNINILVTYTTEWTYCLSREQYVKTISQI